MIAIAAGTYAYVATLNGKESGKTTVTVVRNADGTATISEDGSGSYQGMTGSAKATLSLAADNAPTAYASHVNVAGNAFDSGVAFAGEKATVTGIGPSQTFSLLPTQHFVVLDGALLSGFIALPAQVAAWPGAPLQLIAPVYGQAAPLVLDAAAKPVRPATVPANDVAVAFSAPIGLVEWYDPATMILDELDVPSQGLAVTRTRP